MNPTLCQLPSCRQRGRHLPACQDDGCGGCLPRLTTEGLVCQACMDRAERRLAEIERLCPDARLVAAGQVRRGHGGTGGKPGSRSPANDDALDAMDAVTNALTTFARDIAETRGLTFGMDGRSGRSVAPWSGENRSEVVRDGVDALRASEARTDNEGRVALP